MGWDGMGWDGVGGAGWGARLASRGSSLLLPAWWEELQHTLVPWFPCLSVGMTVPFETLGALWLEVTASAVML